MNGYMNLALKTELWQKHEEYTRYYYWISYCEGKLCSITKYKKLLYEGELTIFEEKMDRRKKIILEELLEGYTLVSEEKKEQFLIDIRSPYYNILYNPKQKPMRRPFIINKKIT